MVNKMTPAGIALIKHFESLHDGDESVAGLQPKLCPAGVWTVGYGRALRDGQGRFLRGQERKAEAYAMYPELTIEEAEAMLSEDLRDFGRDVAGLLRVPVTDDQYSALVSLAYNIGIHAFKNSTVLRCLNSGGPGTLQKAADAFLLWNKSKGRVLSGLVRRREAERRLFLS